MNEAKVIKTGTGYIGTINGREVTKAKTLYKCLSSLTKYVKGQS